MIQTRLLEILNLLREARIGVIGDFCLDAYWQLDASPAELSLETGKPTHAVVQQRYSLGGAGNVVNNIHSLGVGQVQTYGIIADDLFGREMRREFEALQVKTSGLVIQNTDLQTPVYAKPYLGQEEQSRIDFGRFNSFSQESERQLISGLTEGIKTLDALVVNQQLPNGLFTSNVISILNSLAREHAEKVFLVDSRHRIRAFESMICKLNAIEAARLFGKTIERNDLATKDELLTYSRSLFEQFRKPVFITRSQLGALLFDGKNEVEIPAIQVAEPIDPVGAGDTVVAAMASALTAKASLLEAASLAMLAAAVTVRKLQQTGTATPAEILALASNLSSSPV